MSIYYYKKKIIGSISDEASLVIANIQAGGGLLTTNEKASLSLFVDSEVANGNWNLIDEIQCFKFSDNLCRGVGWKAVADATYSSGDVTEGVRIGLTTGSIVDSNIDLSTLTNYSLNDALVLVRNYQNYLPLSNAYYFGVRDSVSDNSAYIRQNGALGLERMLLELHDFSNEIDNSEDTTPSNADYGMFRDTDSTVGFIKNGVVSYSAVNVANRNIPSAITLYYGRLNEDGVPDGAAVDYTLEIGVFGSYNGFNVSAHNINKSEFISSF